MALPLDYLRRSVDQLETELGALTGPDDPRLDSWMERLRRLTLDLQSGSTALAQKLDDLRWRPVVRSNPLDRRTDFSRVYGQPERRLTTMFLQAESTQRAKEQARAILDDVRWELDRQEAASPSPGHIQLDGETIDPELWAHVSTLVETQDWEKIPREAASFVEHRLRIWGDISPTVKGRVDVFKQALSEQHLPLGDAGAEQQGWVQIGVGFVLAVANSAHHKLNDRSDQRRYAVGVLGIASLILGEVRRRYSPRIEMAADANLGHPG